MEIFSSVNAIKDLVKSKDLFFDTAREHVKDDAQKLEEIDRYIADTNTWLAEERDVAKSWSDDDYGFVEHPIAALHVISIWLRLQRKVGPDFKPHHVNETSPEAPGVQYPTQLDYTGAVAALVRLQRTYKLDTGELAAGRVDQTPAAHGLHPGDCYAMALSWMSSDHGAALSWFRQLSDADLEALDSRREYHSHLVQIYMKKEDSGHEAQITEDLRILGDTNELKKRDLYKQQSFWKQETHFKTDYYEALCRGENITNTILKNKNLMCMYKRGTVPYIQYKEEIHSFSPRISLFHDVISDSQSEMLKRKANPGLHRAFVGAPSNYFTTDVRISKLSWLSDSDPEVARKSRQVSDITGLDTEQRSLLSSGDNFQIVNYGLGGQYEPHYDFYEDPSMLTNLPLYVRDTGDRMSTFMYYLSDVKAGGATVFPEIGVRVPPVKNAATFWYNIRLSGETDRRTLHAGCPVLLGQKWVGNKWIREAGQVFRRPCGLNSNETDPIWS